MRAGCGIVGKVPQDDRTPVGARAEETGGRGWATACSPASFQSGHFTQCPPLQRARRPTPTLRDRASEFAQDKPVFIRGACIPSPFPAVDNVCFLPSYQMTKKKDVPRSWSQRMSMLCCEMYRKCRTRGWGRFPPSWTRATLRLRSICLTITQVLSRRAGPPDALSARWTGAGEPSLR